PGTGPPNKRLNLSLPVKNLVHPPPFSTAPTSVFLDPLIILAHITFILISLTGKQHLGLSAFLPLVDHSINQLVSRFLFPCPSHFTVNKTHYHKSLSPELLFCMWGQDSVIICRDRFTTRERAVRVRKMVANPGGMNVGLTCGRVGVGKPRRLRSEAARIEPMDLGRMSLTQEERSRGLSSGRCLYCSAGVMAPETSSFSLFPGRVHQWPSPTPFHPVSLCPIFFKQQLLYHCITEK
ncbi:hypothetical protein ATANTOWER_003182, partial [Ataeniobius toweri]|nr:hypothetical protein [Ataeniobius toweri]